MWRMQLKSDASVKSTKFSVESKGKSVAKFKKCDTIFDGHSLPEIPHNQWFLFPVGQVIIGDSGDELPLRVSISQTDSERKSGWIIDCFILSREPDSEIDTP